MTIAGDVMVAGPRHRLTAVDKIMSWYMWPSQLDPHRSSVPQEDSALWHAGYGGQERGSHVGWHRKGSWTVAATVHPVRALVGGATAAAGVAAVVGSLTPRLLRH